jgi:hypothetical protein
VKIQSPSTIPFKNYIRVHLQDKSRSPLVVNQTPMDKIFSIASENETPLFIAKDVFILDSSDKIKEDLQKSNIEYQEVEENNERKN